MRLTCPNCGAQYEVPDEVIPESGRDVQCSNCGDTWFQHHPDNAPEPDEQATDEPEWDAPSAEDEGEEPEVEEAEVEETPEPEIENPEDEGDEDADEGDPEAEAESPSRKELDPAVTDVLREEAERERAARAADGGDGLETQPELGLNEGADEADRRTQEAQSRMARLRGEPEIEEEDEGPDPGTRRNLLPDIDEINSSLSSDSTDPGMVHPSDADEAALTRKSGGFRRGFMTMVLLAIIGLLLYMFAPQLAAAVPALDGALSGYVEMIDGLRGWLDQTVGGFLGTLDGMSSEGG